MDKRKTYVSLPGISEARLKLYDELNEQGKAFVDMLALSLEKRYSRRKTAQRGMGMLSLRELAIAVLERCWNGELPYLATDFVADSRIETDADLDGGER